MPSADGGWRHDRRRLGLGLRHDRRRLGLRLRLRLGPHVRHDRRRPGSGSGSHRSATSTTSPTVHSCHRRGITTGLHHCEVDYRWTCAARTAMPGSGSGYGSGYMPGPAPTAGLHAGLRLGLRLGSYFFPDPYHSPGPYDHHLMHSPGPSPIIMDGHWTMMYSPSPARTTRRALTTRRASHRRARSADGPARRFATTTSAMAPRTRPSPSAPGAACQYEYIDASPGPVDCRHARPVHGRVRRLRVLRRPDGPGRQLRQRAARMRSGASLHSVHRL